MTPILRDPKAEEMWRDEIAKKMVAREEDNEHLHEVGDWFQEIRTLNEEKEAKYTVLMRKKL